MPGRIPWEGDTRLAGLLVAESEPDHDGIPGLADIRPGFRSGALVPSCKAAEPTGCLEADEVLRGSGAPRRGAVSRTVVGRSVVRGGDTREVEGDGQATAGCFGQAGGAAVRGDQPVHDGQAEPGAVRVRGAEAQEGTLAVLGVHAGAVVG